MLAVSPFPPTGKASLLWESHCLCPKQQIPGAPPLPLLLCLALTVFVTPLIVQERFGRSPGASLCLSAQSGDWGSSSCGCHSFLILGVHHKIHEPSGPKGPGQAARDYTMNATKVVAVIRHPAW